MLKRLLFSIFIIQAGAILSFGQVDDCEIILNRATEQLDAGHFLGIDSLLMPCLKGGFSREQRQRAYLLLTQVYLLLDDSESAKESYLKLLRANPEFEADPSRDPIDVVYLSKKFTASPVFSLFGRLGGNASIVRVIKSLSITGENINTKYNLKVGWTVAAGVDWNITPAVSLSTEFQYSFMAYERMQTDLWSTSTTALIEKQNWVGAPILIKYSFSPDKKLVPYVYGGLGFSFLLKTTGNPTLIDRASATDEAETPSRSPDVTFEFKRNEWNRSLIVGGGVRYKWGLHYLIADLRYSFGLSNLVDYDGAVYDYSHSITNGENINNTSDPLVSSGTPVWRQAYSDDFFRMDNLYLTIGYQHQLYKPRELKKARTQSIFRKLGKKK